MEHASFPVYCETFLNTAGSLPYEPINTLTSLVPFVFGLLALWFLYSRSVRNPFAYTLAFLATATGLGSTAWHGLRTELTLTLDWVPGVFYFLLMIYAWPAALKMRWLGLVTIFGLFGGIAFLPRVEASFFGLLGALFLVSCFLFYKTHHVSKRALWFAVAMVGCGLVAITLRMLDLSVCQYIPFGTHFFWHIFLGTASYLGVRLVVALQQ